MVPDVLIFTLPPDQAFNFFSTASYSAAKLRPAAAGVPFGPLAWNRREDTLMKLSCPHCHQRIGASEEFFGQVVDCPNCGGQLVVPREEYKYWAFLSYSHQDNLATRADGTRGCLRWADWLHQQLETYRVPADFRLRRLLTGEAMPHRFYPVFQDEKELPINADLRQSIRKALEQSRFLIVICSPRSAVSRYVNEEVRYFKQLGRADRILTLMIDGEPNVSDGQKVGIPRDRECFCPALRHPLGLDGVENLTRQDAQEPIAGDVRVKLEEPARECVLSDLSQGHQSVLERATFRLLAGLMGVGFDELVQRDRVREETAWRFKQRRDIAIMAVSAIFFIAAVFAIIFALQQRQVARSNEQEKKAQTKIAIAQTLEAQTQRSAVERRSYAQELVQLQRAWDGQDYRRIRKGLAALKPSAGSPDLRGWEWHYLRMVAQEPLHSITVSSSPQSSGGAVWQTGTVSWHPSGRWIATGGGTTYSSSTPDTMQIQIRDASSGQLLHDLGVPGSLPVWNSTGNQIAALVANEVHVWDFPSGKLVRRYRGHGVRLWSVAWRPGFSHVTASGHEGDKDSRGNYKGELLIWDTSNDQALLDLSWKDKGVRGIAWRPDGKLLAVSWRLPELPKRKYYVSLFDPQTGAEVSQIENTKTSQFFGVSAMAWRNDGTTIAMDEIASRTYPIDLFDASTKQWITTLGNGGQKMTWSSDGSKLLSMTAGPTSTLFRLWEPDDLQRSTLVRLPSSERPGTMAWHPDGAKFATFSRDPHANAWTLEIWDLAKARKIHEVVFAHSRPSTAFGWRSDGAILASASSDGELCLCAADQKSRMIRPNGHAGPVTQLEWRPGRSEFLTVGTDGLVKLWNVAGLEGLQPLNSLPIQAVATSWHRDGARVALGNRSGKIVVWDAERSAPVKETQSDASSLIAIQWHPKRDEIAVANADGGLLIWDCNSNRRIASAKSAPGSVRKLAYDPEGRQLATCGDDSRVQIWNASTLEPGLKLAEHQAKVVALSWNPLDGRLATADEEGVIWVWDPQLGGGLLRVQDAVVSHSTVKSEIRSPFRPGHLAWSPDGIRLSACGTDSSCKGREGAIHIWTAEKPHQ